MLGSTDLKIQIKISDETVDCPVRDCDNIVDRQRDHFRCEQRFQCPDHKIFISPTTFEYPDKYDNLLWTNSDDCSLIERINVYKRENRMARDNSEDAVTWNVFRYLEKACLLRPFLSSLAQEEQGKAELIYWSYSQSEFCNWLFSPPWRD